jgi:hypothetical protein
MPSMSRPLTAALATLLVATPAAIAKQDLHSPDARDAASAHRFQSPTSSLAGTTSVRPAGIAAPPILRPSGRADRQSLLVVERQRAAASSDRASASGPYSTADTNAYAATVRAASSAATKTVGTGFDYHDAAIGAGTSAAIALLLAGGTVTLRRRARPQAT